MILCKVCQAFKLADEIHSKESCWAVFSFGSVYIVVRNILWLNTQLSPDTLIVFKQKQL